MYDFHFDDIAKFVTRKGARTVVLQMPEGLKVYAQRIVTEVENRTRAKCLNLTDPCYGACDVYSDFRHLGDVLVHIGHADIPSMNVSDRVLFIEVGFDFNVSDLLEKAAPKLKDRIGAIHHHPASSASAGGDALADGTWQDGQGRHGRQPS